MFCFFQAEDGIRDLVRSRGLGDVYKRQVIINIIKKNFIKLIIKLKKFFLQKGLVYIKINCRLLRLR